MIYQLIYRSQAMEKTDWETLEALMTTSINNNKESDLTGMLLFTGEHFLQVLEGEYIKINRTFYDICRDKRHHNLKLITFTPVVKRHFSEWSMRLVNYNNLDLNLKEHLTRKYGVVNNSLVVPDDPLLAFSLLFDIYTMDQS